MNDSQTWYIVKRAGGNCGIIASDQVGNDNVEIIEQWGPFSSQEEAIGLESANLFKLGVRS
jgi:hypothetical protein